jgi:antitoxin component YwqK of YwqJK toxin-antitoxin module
MKITIYILLIFFPIILFGQTFKIDKVLEKNKLFEKDSVLFYNNKPFEGELIENFPNKSLKYSVLYVNGKPNGHSNSYDIYGKLKSKGDYKNGLKDGYWEESTFKFYYVTSGWINKEVGHFLLGDKNGEWNSYIKHDIVKTITYDMGRIILEVQYDKNQKLYSKFNLVSMLFEKYYPNGKIENMGENNERGERTGEWSFFNENGKLVEKTYYKNDLENGDYEIYDVDGYLEVKGTKKNNKKYGRELIYFQSGQIASIGNYINDKKVGLWENFSSRGNIIERNNYKMGVLDGTHEEYFLNGIISQKGNYVNGKKVGFWDYYTEKGNHYRRELYKNGIMLNY